MPGCTNFQMPLETPSPCRVCQSYGASVTDKDAHVGLCGFLLTLINIVNLNLSSGWLPRAPGNSQSISRPSKLWRLRYRTTLLINIRMLVLVARMDTKGLDPMYHPPTARRTFRSGFFSLRATVRAYRPKHMRK